MTVRALLLTTFYPPRWGISECICTAKLAKALVARGIELTAVTSNFDPAHMSRDDSGYWSEGMGRVIRLEPPTPALFRRAVTLYGRARALDAQVTWLWRSAYARARELLASEPFDFFFTRCEPFEMTHVGWRLRRATGVRWVACFSDPYPVFLYPPPYRTGKPENLYHRMQLRLLRRILRDADRVIYPNQRMTAYMKRVLGGDIAGKIAAVPHVGWNEAPQPPPADGTVEILHAGIISSPRLATRLFESVAESARSLPGLRERLRLCFLGQNDAGLSRFIEREKLGGLLRAEGQVSVEESLKRMQRASALLLMEAQLEEGIFLPSKFCDYAVSGKPLLIFSPERGVVSDLVGGRSHPGFLGQTEEGYRERVAEFLAALAAGDDLAAWKYPRPKEFSPEAVAEKFLDEALA